MERSMALALVNALNHGEAIRMKEDVNNHLLFDTLNIRRGSRVAMVVFFKPLMKLLAGTVPMDSDAAIKAVRHGRGTPALRRVSKKVVAVTVGQVQK